MLFMQQRIYETSESDQLKNSVIVYAKTQEDNDALALIDR